MLEIKQIPVLTDNYVYLLKDSDTGKVAAVDPSEAEPVLKTLRDEGWKLDYILNTHHHWDHVGGNLTLKEKTKCEIVGWGTDAVRIPGITIQLKPGAVFQLGKSEAEILFIPGHTHGHIAFWFEKDKALFCGDTLFSLGCGRLFEGTAQEMFTSLNLLKALPDDTLVYCAHEYTLPNGLFALSVDGENAKLIKKVLSVMELRASGKTTVPSLLGEEKVCNPFLTAPNERRFAEIRSLKDHWKS